MTKVKELKQAVIGVLTETAFTIAEGGLSGGHLRIV